MYCVYCCKKIPSSERFHRCDESSNPSEASYPNYSLAYREDQKIGSGPNSIDTGRRALPRKTFK